MRRAIVFVLLLALAMSLAAPVSAADCTQALWGAGLFISAVIHSFVSPATSMAGWAWTVGELAASGVLTHLAMEESNCYGTNEPVQPWYDCYGGSGVPCD